MKCRKIVFLSMLLITTISYATEDFLERYLKEFENGRNWQNRVAFQAETTTDITGNDLTRINYGKRKYTTTYRRNNGKMELIGNNLLLDGESKEMPEGSFDYAYVFDGNTYFHSDKYHEETKYLAFITREYKEEQESLGHSFEGGAFLDGCPINDSYSISSLLSKCQSTRVLDNKLMIEDNNCVCLEGIGDFGKLTIWSCPEKDFRTVKYRIEKKTGDIFRDDKKVEDFGLESWVMEVNSIQFEKINGKYFPVKGNYSEKTVFKDGLVKEMKIETCRKEIDTNPDFDKLKAFTIPLPDGVTVGDIDFPGVWYETIDGKLRAYVDDDITKLIDNTFDSNNIADTKTTVSQPKIPDCNIGSKYGNDANIYKISSPVSSVKQSAHSDKKYAIILTMIGLAFTFCLTVYGIKKFLKKGK